MLVHISFGQTTEAQSHQNHRYSAFPPRPRPNQNHLSFGRKLYLEKDTNITFTFAAALHKLTYLLWHFAFSVNEARH